VPDDPNRTRVVRRDGLDAQHPPPHPDRSDPLEADEERRRAAPLEARDRGVSAPVLVPKRQGQEKVSDGAKSVRGQALAARRADAGNPGDGIARAEEGGRGVQ